MIKTNRLPKYWVVQQCDDSRWHKVVGYINTFNSGWTGNGKGLWYGFDGSNTWSGVNYGDHPRNFQNKPVQLTLDQFIEMTEEFVLPESWCIRGCDEFEMWCEQNSPNVYGLVKALFHYPMDVELKRWSAALFIPKGYREITFDQFFTHVVKTRPFDPSDWNVECKTKAQYQEVLQWISDSKYAPIELDRYKHDYYQFIRITPTHWACCLSRDSDYSIEKSITWEQFQTLKRSSMTETDLIDFDPTDWNIECKNAAQTQEVLDWFRLEGEVVSETAHNGEFYQFIRYKPQNWSGNNQRTLNHPIRKTITWEQFQTLKKSLHRKETTIKGGDDFDPLDWNIECKNIAQTQEVMQWISDTNHDVHESLWGNYYQFIRLSLSDWGGNGTRIELYPIEKSISWEQFQALKTTIQIKAPTAKEVTESSMTSTYQTITRDNLKQIYDLVCPKWQLKIIEKIKEAGVFNATISFTTKEVKKLFSSSTTPKQLTIISRYFTKPVKDRNAFIEKEGNFEMISKLSNQLFDDIGAFQLLENAAPVDGSKLRNIAFFVSEFYEVITGPTTLGGTYIKIQKKQIVIN